MMPQTASEWIVALHDRPHDAALRHRHQGWLAADPAHQQDWHETLHVWRLLGLTVPAHADLWAARPATVFKQRALWRRKGIGFGLAAAALAACLALIWAPGVLLSIQADHVTADGQMRSIALPDGSQVHLAPGSALRVDFAPEQRRVELLAGQAFFEVVPNSSTPFAVLSDHVQTTVLGTAFDVQHGPHGINVAVNRGLVQVAMRPNAATAPFAPQRLAAGEGVYVGEDGISQNWKTAPTLIAAWRQGQLVAKDLPVADAVERLRHYFKGWIVLADDELARQPLTGVYTLSDPLTALRAIAGAQGAEVKEISPWILVLSKP